MARPRRGKRRRQSHDWLRHYLITGIEPEDHELDNVFDKFDLCHDAPERKAAWESMRDRIMGNWNKPGCRPFAWWLYDAPRLPEGTFPGCFYDGELPEPRMRLDGPGMPLHERLNFVPSQHFGIWAWFGDPENPPVFESQFDYLKRHGLLMPGEDEPIPEPHPHPVRIMDAAEWEKRRKERVKNDG